MPNRKFPLAGLALGLAAVGLVTAALYKVLPANASTVGFVYLLVVLGVATTAGFRVSAIVSLTAMLCFNFFFLPPVGYFTIADPANWVALMTFLITALVASHLSDRAQSQAAEAKRRQLETEQLYALSRSILLTDAAQPIGTQAARSIAQIFDSPAVLILDGKSRVKSFGGARELQAVDSLLDEVMRQGNHVRDESQDLDVWPIALGGTPVGALGGVRLRISDGAVQSMLNLVAIALERVRTEEAANRAEVARQSEEFKSTLLDAIAHEFKTPLTSIKAAATGLTQLKPDQQELTAIIVEETDRLSALVTEAVKMAEIDAGKVKPRLAKVDAQQLVVAAVNSFDGRGSERIQIGIPDQPAPVHADSDLMVLALRQVLDNALKYSEPSTRVTATVRTSGDWVLLRIADHGRGIPEQDRERVFDKFYRRPKERSQTPGSGLGLHIAREIARIHHGDLTIAESSGQGQGAVLTFSLPKEARQ